MGDTDESGPTPCYRRAGAALSGTLRASRGSGSCGDLLTAPKGPDHGGQTRPRRNVVIPAHPADGGRHIPARTRATPLNAALIAALIAATTWTASPERLARVSRYHVAGRAAPARIPSAQPALSAFGGGRELDHVGGELLAGESTKRNEYRDARWVTDQLAGRP